MPTYQGLNDRGLIGKYDYLTLDLAQTAKFYADDTTPFITSGFGSTFDIEEITSSGSGIYEVKLLNSNDLSDIVEGAKLRLRRTEKSLEVVVDIVGVDTNKIIVKSSFDIEQSTRKGSAFYHPFFGGFKVKAITPATFEMVEENAFGLAPSSITLDLNQSINTNKITSLVVSSGKVAITLL